MAKRKQRRLGRTRTVVVFRDGVVGYYSRDRIAGGISPIYATEALLAAARVTKAEQTANGTKARWAAAT
jgi:hypothetical protein